MVTLGEERDRQLQRYPYGTCENGGGMPPAYHRRPMIRADDVAALAMVKVGSGSNLQGYYMYHGGSNPEGKLTTMQESQATGYPNDLPVVSYDFQAPLGEYGQVNDSFHALRPLHLFLADFGDRLAPLTLALPDVTPNDVDDRRTLRWAARSDGERAFLFVNNYQRLEELPDHPDVQFQLRMNAGTIRVPARPTRVAAGAWFFWPVNFDLDGLLLSHASAQPLCRLATQEGGLYVFAAQPGIEPEFAFGAGVLGDVGGAVHRRETVDGMTILCGLEAGPGCILDLCGTAGRRVRVLVLRQEDARRLYKAEVWRAERLLISGAVVLVDGDDVHVRSRQPEAMGLAIYPDASGGSWGGRAMPGDRLGIFTRYPMAAKRRTFRADATRVRSAGLARPVRIGPAGVATVPDEAAWQEAETWQVRIPAQAMNDAAETCLVVDYVGDAARATVGDRLVADDFYNGRPWEIGLRRLTPQVLRQGLMLRFLPLRRDAPIYIEKDCLPDFAGQESLVHVRDMRIELEFERVFVKRGCESP